MSHEITPCLLSIEVATTLQLPSFNIVGLPNPEVAEAKERVRAAIEASGFRFPRKRVLVNLSPAHLRKHGTGLDLPIALAVLLSSRKTKKRNPTAHPHDRKIWVAWGELGLDGNVKTAGSITRAIHSSWQARSTLVILSHDDFSDAQRAHRLIRDANCFNWPPPRIVPVGNLAEAWSYLESIMVFGEDQGDCLFPKALGHELLHHARSQIPVSSLMPLSPSLARMLGIAASGRHHLLLLGPRGSGKSHALEWLVSLQPKIPPDLELTRVLISEMGGLSSSESRCPSFSVRRISAQVRPAALIGSVASALIRPGEFSLAHGGLLIADEIPEWSRDSREILREPMERGQVTLTRTHGTVELPARFTLAANGNFCPCGGWPPELSVNISPDTSGGVTLCRCSHQARSRYLSRISGALLDRIDLVIQLRGGTAEKKCSPTLEELQDSVKKAVERSMAAWGNSPGYLSGGELEQILSDHPHWQGHPALKSSDSLRGRHKILRIALSLASWDGASEPTASHMIEASFYRPEHIGLGG